MPRKLDLKTLQETAQLVDQLGTQVAAARALGLSPLAVCLRLKKLRKLTAQANPPAKARKDNPVAKPQAEGVWASREMEHWQRYIDGGRQDQALRNSLIDLQMKSLQHLAQKMHQEFGGRVPAEDLLQEGVLGLMDAAQRYDPATGYKFWTYAARRCLGAMQDHVRGRDYVPRSVRLKVKRREAFEAAFHRQQGYAPLPEEVMAGLGWNEAQLAETEIRGLESIDRIIFETDTGTPTELRQLLMATCDDPEASHNFEDYFRDLLRGLPMDEVVLLWLYVVREATMKKISVALDLSESRVSQLMTAAKARLVRKLCRADLVA